MQAAAQGTALEPHLVGELIASEVEVKTGRCETFADIPAAMAERRAQLQALVDPLGIALGATGTHPWSPWQEQRIIDTPHYRRNDELLRYVVWRNNSFGLHVHVGIRGADRAIAVVNGLRNLLPEMLALSASSPFVENVNSGLHSARTQIFTRFFPRCGVPDAFSSWQEYEDYVRFLYETGSVTEHTQIWWSVRPHLAIPDRRDPDLRRTAGPGRRAGAGRVRHRARGADRARLRRGRAARRPAAPADRGEHLACDPLRVSRASCLDLRARRRAARRAPGSSGCSSGSLRSRTRSARRRTSRLPESNAAERQIARFEEGASLEQIYAEQVVGVPVRG